MRETPMNPEYITPNYTKERGKKAEEYLLTLIDIAENLGVEVMTLERSKQEILDAVKENNPERYDIVLKKIMENEGIEDLADLPKEVLLDRLLGIDIMFRYGGRNYTVDVTSGKGTVLKNKKKKVDELEDLYKQLGINNALILRLTEEISEDIVLDLFSLLENINENTDLFSLVVKYPEPKAKDRRRLEKQLGIEK